MKKIFLEIYLETVTEWDIIRGIILFIQQRKDVN